MGIGLLVLVAALDPYGIVGRSWAEPGLARYLLIFVAASLGAVRIFAHPFLELGDRAVRIVGVLRDVRAPYGAIEEVDTDHDVHLRIRIDGRFRTVMGLEQPGHEMLRGRAGITHTAAEQLRRRVAAAPRADQEVVRSFTRPDVGEVVLLLAWLALGIASALAAHSGR